MRRALLLIIFAFYSITLFAQPSTVTKVPISSRNSNPRGYVEYLPPNYNSRTDWPVIVYMHGVGSARGSGSNSDLNTLLNNNIMGFVNGQNNDRDFIILAPQDFNGLWGPRGYTFFEWAQTEYASKSNLNNWHAIYNSGGGGGFDRWCTDNPSSLSVVASHTPMSALTSSGTSAAHENLASSGGSLWFHHNIGDNTVGYGQTRNYFRGVVNALGVYNDAKYRYTLYDQGGHNANSEVYTNNGWSESKVTGTLSSSPVQIEYYDWTSESWWDWLLLQERGLAPDATPPVLSNVVDNAISSIAGTVSVTTNENNGILYWVVTSSPTSPNATQIMEGRDHTSSIAELSGDRNISQAGEQNISFSGLTFSTTYYVHFVHTDNVGNISNVASSNGFTTNEEDYHSVLANVSVGDPDFTWTLDGTTDEVNGLSTSSVGSISYSASLIPGMNSDQSWQTNGTSYINPSNSNLINTDAATESRSISFWFEATNPNGWQNLYEEGGETNGWHIALYDDYLTMSITSDGTPSNSIQYQISPNEVYHVVGVFDLSDQGAASNMELFLNGASVGTSKFTNQNFLAAHSGDIQFGGSGDGQFIASDQGSKTVRNFVGKIQRVDYWSERELSSQDVSDIYTLGGEGVISPPTQINLDNNEINDGTTSGTKIASISSNGTDPLVYNLVSGSGDSDNASFSIIGKDLFVEEEVMFSQQGTYTIRLGVSNAEGATSRSFSINVTNDVKPQLRIIPNDVSSTYGADLPELSYELVGFIDGDDISIFSQNELPSITTNASAQSPVGTYNISTSGGSSDKYEFVYENGTLEITRAALSVSVEDVEIFEGEQIPDFLLTYDGFVAGDSRSDLIEEPVASTSAATDSPAGQYTISIAGGLSANYIFVYGQGTLIIKKKCNLQSFLTYNQSVSLLYVVIDGGTPPYSIRWDTGETGISLILDNPSGTYKALVTDADDCVSESIINLEEGQVILGTTANEIVTIYPNPAENILYLQDAVSNEVIQIFNLSGQRILSKTLRNNKEGINISTLSSGLYYIHIGDKSLGMFVKK